MMRASIFIIVVMTAMFTACDQQKPDPDFQSQVEKPAFTFHGPRVLFDEAHRNVHTTGGTYAPFCALIKNDGFTVTPNELPFTLESLKDYDILVIANAKGERHKFDPAFTTEENSAVEAWVRGGGNLFLIADHTPFGASGRELALRFGVTMINGVANDSVFFDSTTVSPSPVDGRSQLIFTRFSGLVNDHPITTGRDSTEYINRIISFTGQSLYGPEGSTSFLTLSPHAYNVIPDSIWDEPEMIFFTKTLTRFVDPVSAGGMSQGLAMEFGKGRVVVLGEAAMMTAQLAGKEKFGMQVAGFDDRQLALNIMRWLGRAL